MIEGLSFESERLKTCRLIEEDSEPLFTMYSDGDAMKYRGSRPMECMQDAYDMVSANLVVKNQILKLRLGIRNKSDNLLVGTLLLTWDEDFKEQCEIGFSFGKEHWGKGYGKETLRMVENQLVSHKTIKEVKAWCIKENHASIRIFEKAGFSKLSQDQHPDSKLFLKEVKPEAELI